MTDKKNAPELLPCPFCGGEAGFFDKAFDGTTYAISGIEYVKCYGCDRSEGFFYKTKYHAANSWNTRADLHADAIRQARNEALREAADKCMSLKQTGGPITPGECCAAILDMIDQGRLT